MFYSLKAGIKTIRITKVFCSTKSNDSNNSKYYTFSINIPKLKSFKKFFGDTFMTGNKEDLAKINKLVEKHGITYKTIDEYDLNTTHDILQDRHTEGITRYIKLDQEMTPGTIILCDATKEGLYFRTKVSIISITFLGIIAILIENPAPLIFSFVCIPFLFDTPYTAQLAKLREVYLYGDPNKIVETHENKIKQNNDNFKNRYDKYLQSKE